MIYSEFKLVNKIFERFLPPNASRGGYFEGAPNEGLYKEGIYPIPIQVAPVASLDGLWIDSQHSPTDSRQFAALVQTLTPSGIAVAFLNSRNFSRKQILDFCKSAGLQILFLSPIMPSGKIKLNRSGLPIPKSIYRRLMLRLTTWGFPFLKSLFGSYFFLVAQRSPKRLNENSDVRISVVIPIVRNRSNKNRLQQWEEFVAAHRLHQLEIVCVEDENEQGVAESKLGSTIRIQHSTKTGVAGAIRTGLIHSSGQLVLIDSTENRASPAFLFDLLLKRSESKSKADVIVCVDANNKPNWFQRFKNRLMTGFSDSSPLMILLNDKAVNSIIELHNDQIKDYQYAIELKLGSSNLVVDEVEMYPNPALQKSDLSNSPSLFQYLRYRLHKGMVYLLMPLLLTGVLLSSYYLIGFIASSSQIQGVISDLFQLEQVAKIHSILTSAVTSAVISIENEPNFVTGNLAGIMLGNFLFILGLGQLIHFSNTLLVFRRAANSFVFSWVVAQFEAVLVFRPPPFMAYQRRWVSECFLRLQEMLGLVNFSVSISTETFLLMVWFTLCHFLFALIYWQGFRRPSVS